ncbi:MAG: sugar phosphorylase [Candidatus Nealsonbacteria bacterium]|nr:sugar phosphorylase [Candidatus Nealsonbacteria bacterium]
MPISDVFRPRIAAKLRQLYGARAEEVLRGIDGLADRYAALRQRPDPRPCGPQTVTLITYGDQIQSEGRPSLQVLNGFLHEYGCDQVISGIHILPCFPYSSDDGFSVIDYRQIDASLGDWGDVDSLGKSFGLMLDYVVNHCSQENAWFQGYLRGEEPYVGYFIDADPETDLSAVTRPRSAPLLTPFETGRGTKHVWTTFSADQVDLDFANPDVLLEMLDVLLLYVMHGARAIRLDAIGFLWKKIGTTCMHLPQTHTVVKIMRDLLDDVAPGTVLVTETNVPHAENISYFGAGDEAHAVYNFSLAPLLLDAFYTGDAGPIHRWLATLEYPGPGMTYFNFTASHDGIGVRPLEGLVSQQRLDNLVDEVRRRGGRVNTRRKPDGTDSPYELNITYLSALDSPAGLPPRTHARRFLTSQGVMLALRGVPGIYFHSLVGTPNYVEGVEQTGHNRTINRRKFDVQQLRQILSDEQSVQRMVFDGYLKMLAVRTQQAAFHPDAGQAVVDTGRKSVIAFERISQDGRQRILVLANIGAEPVCVDLSAAGDVVLDCDLLTGQSVVDGQYEVDAYDIAWLCCKHPA